MEDNKKLKNENRPKKKKKRFSPSQIGKKGRKKEGKRYKGW